MGLDMYLKSAPKVKNIEELEEMEKRLSEAYYAGEKKFKAELKKIQKEKKFKNPISYEISDWPKNKEDYDKWTSQGEHIAKVVIRKQIGYWRKFNALHAWFVKTFQDGIDECQSSIVDPKILQELLFSLAKINKDNAGSILPPQEGFFFGGTDMDRWYWDSVEQLKIFLMDLFENNDFKENALIYRASW
jgi:hypothetical protein